MKVLSSTTKSTQENQSPAVGEMSRLIQQYNWGESSLGDPATWSASLRITLNTILHSPFPMLLFWGEELTCFYNDAFRPSLGNEGKHPGILGKRGEDAWHDTWHFAGPLINKVFYEGQPCLYQNQLVPIFRNGKLENVYWTFSYSPVKDEDDQIRGVLVVCQETTSLHNQTEKAIQDSEERLRIATSSANIGTWSYDIVSNKVHVSDEYKKLFGLSPEREMTYELFLQSVVEEDRAITEQVNNDVMAMKDDASDYECEYRIRGIEDNQLRWLKARGKVYTDSHGKPARFAGAVIDITKEKEAQEALRYRKALLEAQNNAVPDSLLIVDTKGGIISYNKQFGELWDLPPECLEKKDDNLALHYAMSKVTDPQAFINRVNECYANPGTKAFDIIQLKDGRTIERQGSVVTDDEGKSFGWIWHFRDITADRNAEAALSYQKQLLETVTSNTSLALFMMDDRQHCIYMNEAAEEMTGFSLEELQGKQLHYYIHHTHPNGEPYPLEECPIDQALPTQMRMKGEDVFVHKNGRFFPVAFIASPILVGGKPVGTVIEVRDTTEEKEKENTLIESEQRFRSIADDAPAFLFMIGPDAQVEFINKTWLEFIGLSAEEASGRGWTHIIHPDELTWVLELYSDAFNNQKAYEFEVRQRNKDGEYRWIYWKGVPRYVNGKFLGMMGIGYDVTERKNAERALIISTERFEMVARATQDVIWDWDLQTDKIWWNNGLQTLFNYNIEEIEPGVESWYNRVHPDDKERVISGIHSVIESGKKSWGDEYRFLKADGTYAVVFDRGYAVQDAGGQAIRMLGSMQDITERKEVEVRLRENEQRFRGTFNNAAVGIAQVGLDGKWLLVNDRLCKIVGYTEPELLASTFQQITYPADLGNDISLVNQVLENKLTTYSIEKRYIRKDRSLVWVNLTVSLVRNKEGKPDYFISILEDIDARKKTEEALRKSEEKYRQLFEIMEQGFCIIEMIFDENNRPLDYRFIECNPVFNKQTGLVDSIGKTARSLIPDLEDKWFHIYGNVALTGEPARFVEDSKAMNRWFEVFAFRIGDQDSRQVAILFTDVSERKKTEQVLRESEERFSTIANDTPAFIFMADADTNIDFLNKQWLSFVGQPFEVAKGKAWADITHPEDVPPMLEVYSNAVATHQPYQFEIRQRAADGEYHTVLWKGIPRIGVDGEFKGMLGVGIDVTESRKAVDALRESEDLFRGFSNNIQNLAWIADSEGWIYWYNQRWFDYTGTTLEEMQGWGWTKVHHPDHVDRVTAFVKEAWKKPVPFEITFPLRSHTGEYRWFLTRVEPILDSAGNIQRWIGTNTDINNQVEAQQALRQSEEQMRLLSDTMPQIVWATDAHGHHNFFNRQWYQFTGLSPEETKSGGWSRVQHPEDVEKTEIAWKQSVETGNDFEMEYRMRRADGEYRWLLARAVAFRNDNGNLLRWFGTCTDIHDQKLMTDKLEELVRKRTHELQISNEDLQQFAHVASHDLKEPVRKIRTFAGRLQGDKGSSLSENGQLFLSKIESSAQRMYEMIEGVLSYSTLSATQEEPRQVDLNVVIRHIENDLEVVMQQKKARIVCQNLPVVQGAPVLLNQLFYNLLNNSLKFAKPGVPPLIEVSAEKITRHQKAFVKIMVRDNGIGFRQDHALRIFETFARLNSKDQYEGTGLGLSLCKKIVERHGGTIKAQSAPDKGTTISVYLPA